MQIFTKFLIGLFLNGLALFILTKVVEGITYTGGLKFFILGGLVLGLLNSIIKPIIKIFSLPFVILTGGLFLIVINVGLLWLLSYSLDVIQFRDVTLVFQNFSAYVIGAVVFGIINWTLSLIK